MKSPKSFSLIMILFILLGYTELAQAMYNPETGNWLSRDPIEEIGGENLHAFVRNDPLNASDSLGMYVSTLVVTDYHIDPEDLGQLRDIASNTALGISFARKLRHQLEKMSDETFYRVTKNGIFARWYVDAAGKLDGDLANSRREELSRYNVDMSHVSRLHLINWMRHEEESRVDALSVHRLITKQEIYSVLNAYSGDEEYPFDSMGFQAHGSIQRGGVLVGPDLGHRIPYGIINSKLGELPYYESRAFSTCGANNGLNALGVVITDPFYLDESQCTLTFTPLQFGYITGGLAR